MDIKKRVLIQSSDLPNPETGEYEWEEEDDEAGGNGEEDEKVYIGRIPMMLKSHFCVLDGMSDKDQEEMKECPFDKVGPLSSPLFSLSSLLSLFHSALANVLLPQQGGYFIINGSEKVLIAQERMAANRVYVFAKAQPSPVTFLAEIRSAVEKGGKTISSMQVKMMRRNEKQVRLLSLAFLLYPS